MIIDYIKILGLLKDRYSDRFISYENIDESQNEQVKKYITENFSEKEILEVYGETINIPFIELIPNEIPQNLYSVFEEKILQGYQFVPFDIQNDKICIAIVDPYNYNAIQAIKFVLRDKGVDFKLFLTTRNDLNSVFNAFQNISEEVKKSLSELDEEKLKKKGDDLIEEVKPDKEDVEVAPIIKIVSVILKNAVEGGASDIHIEGISKGVRVRFRVDGILHNTFQKMFIQQWLLE